MQSEQSDVQVGCSELRQAWFWRSSMRLSVFFHSRRWVGTFLILMFWDCLRSCPLTAASQMRDKFWLGYLFCAPLLVEQAVPSLKGTAWSFRVLPGDAVVSGQHKTTNILNGQHSGLRLRPTMTSFTCRFALFPSLQGLEVLVASQTWTCPFSLCNKVFKWSAVCTVLLPPFTPVLHLLWLSKL